MRHASHIRGSATEAAGCTPTDWATLGARILAAAKQATAIHMAQATDAKAKTSWSRMTASLDVVTEEADSTEPKA